MLVRLTSRARRFAEINRSAAIISGQWLDKFGKKVTGPPGTWAKLRYRFNNGQQSTLDNDDMASLRAAGVEPRWLLDDTDMITPRAAPKGGRP